MALSSKESETLRNSFFLPASIPHQYSDKALWTDYVFGSPLDSSMSL